MSPGGGEDTAGFGGVAEAFRLPGSARFSVRGIQKATLSVTEIRNNRLGFGLTDPLPYIDGLMLGLQLKGLPRHELWFDGRPMDVTDVAPGDTIFYDMRRNPIAHVVDKSHSLHFILPHAFLIEIAEDLGAPPFDLEMRCGIPHRDPVLSRIEKAVLPLLNAPQDITDLFGSHLMLALGIHVGMNHGPIRAAQKEAGRLSAAQLRMVQELIRANLNGAIDLKTLAAACGLTASRFATAFRSSLGMAPYQWLQMERIKLAMALLRDRWRPLGAVAVLSGFENEIQFTRSFRNAMGVTPCKFRISAG